VAKITSKSQLNVGTELTINETTKQITRSKAISLSLVAEADRVYSIA